MTALPDEGKDFLLSLHDIRAGIVALYDDGRKHPPFAWKHFMPMPKGQEPGFRPTKEQLEEWLKKYRNFGLILGWEYYALDFDEYPKKSGVLHKDTASLLDFLVRETRPWIQKSGSKSQVRRHLIYKKDSTKLLRYFQTLDKYPGLEILGENHILVASGAIHPDGGIYETLRSPLDNEIDIFPYDYLEGLEIGLERSTNKKERISVNNQVITSRHNDARDYLLKLYLLGVPKNIIEQAYIDHINANYPEVLTEENRHHEFLVDLPHDVPNFEVVKEKNKQKESDLEKEEIIPEKLFTTLEELEKKDIPEPRCLVDGKLKILENAYTTIFGPTAQCKSFFLESLFIPWSKGENAFGTSEITTVKSRILLVPTEHSTALEKKRYKHLGGLGNPNIAIYDRADKLRIESEKEVDLLLQTLVKGNFDVVAIDVQSDIHEGDDSSAKDVNKIIRFYRRIIALGKTPIGVAHTKKGEINNLIEAIRGSGEFGNKSACATCIRKTSKTTIVVESAKSRSSELLAPIELEMIINEGQVAGFKYVGETQAFGEKTLESDKAEDMILSTMEDIKQADSELLHNLFRDPETREYTVVKKWAVKEALKNLCAKGVLKFKVGNKGWGGVYTYVQN